MVKLFGLYDGEGTRQCVFNHDIAIDIDNLHLTKRIYFVSDYGCTNDKPKYIEFTSVFALSDKTPTVLIDFITGAKVIYGYTCYNTTKPPYDEKEPYEHSLTFVKNK